MGAVSPAFRIIFLEHTSLLSVSASEDKASKTRRAAVFVAPWQYRFFSSITNSAWYGHKSNLVARAKEMIHRPPECFRRCNCCSFLSGKGHTWPHAVHGMLPTSLPLPAM